MKKINISLLFSLILIFLMLAGCNNVSKNDNMNNNNKSKTEKDILNDSLLNFTQNPLDIKISNLGKTIKTNELKVDIQNNADYYSGIYGADTVDINSNGLPDWEQLIINYNDKKLSAYLAFYESGKKQYQYEILDPEIVNGTFRGNIIEKNDKEILKGKFVYYPDESLPNGKLTGIILDRKGRLIFFTSLYSNGIQNLF